MFEQDSQDSKRRVALYIRVSTAEQKIDGYSLGAQQKKLREYVENNQSLNLETKPEWLYTDVHTGSDLNREGLQKLLADVKAGKFDAVIVWKIDRLSRSLKHLLNIFEDFEKEKVSFISVQENIDFKGPIGRLIFQIFGAIAQFERELIKGRTMMGKIASADAGNYTGTTIPYGYMPKMNKGGKGKKLELVEDEKKWVERMYEWTIFEGHGDEKIARLLNDKHVRKPKWEKNEEGIWSVTYPNTKWTWKMVNNILTNRIYRSDYDANMKDELGNELPMDKWTIVKVPQCVSNFTFEQAQNARKSRDSGASETDYLLSGKLRDMSLEKPRGFVGAKRQKGGFSYRRKQLPEKGISVFEVPGEQIETYVWGKVMEAMYDPEAFIKLYLSKEFADRKRIDRVQTELDELRGRKATLELKIAKVEEAYETGAYSEEKMIQKISEMNSEIGIIENKIQSLEDELSLMSAVDIEVVRLKEASKIVKYRLEKLDRKQKKVICNLFVDRVEMRRTPLEGHGKKKWRVFADIYFRFNPEKFKASSKGLEPQKAGSKPKTLKQEGLMSEYGGPGWS